MLTTDELDGMRTTSALALPATCAVTRPSGDHTLDTATGLLQVRHLAGRPSSWSDPRRHARSRCQLRAGGNASDGSRG